MKNFDYQDWLEKRAAKERTKTVRYSDLTKVEKISTLLNLLGEDFADTSILSQELRAFKDCSAKVQSDYLMKLLLLNDGGAEISIPKPDTMIPITVRTLFAKASFASQIAYLEGLYKKPIDTVTLDLPCGKEWIKGLCEFITNNPEFAATL